MNRSPPPICSAPLRSKSTASHSRELILDAALHAVGEEVARALDAGQVHEHELPALAVQRPVDDPADRPTGRLRPVRGRPPPLLPRSRSRAWTCRRSGGRRRRRTRSASRVLDRLQRSRTPPLQLQHLAAVRSRGRARRDAGPRGRPPLRGPRCVRGRSPRRRAHAGPRRRRPRRRERRARPSRSSRPRKLPLSSRIRSAVDELDADVAVLETRRPQRRLARRPQLRRTLDVRSAERAAPQDLRARAERRSGAWLWPCFE